MTRLPKPDLQSEGDTLRSARFQDIYFSPDDGLAETRHVFIEGNNLAERFSANNSFVIGELGFGTGLNLLAAWAEHDLSGSGPLHFWTCEGFPLSMKAFGEAQAQIGARWPQLKPYADRLASFYPEPLPGQVRIELDARRTLTIGFGPVAQVLREADISADAWFLDGFAPSKNPDMWTPDILHDVARRTKTGGTAATFTVASAVREALTGAGFHWQKTQGFGRKKHMLRAQLKEPVATISQKPWFNPPCTSGKGPVAIIGAGIAGATLASALHREGIDVTVFGTGSRRDAASSNPAGLIMPRLDADDSPAAFFYRDAFLFARTYYEALDASVFHPCGGRMRMDKEKFAALQDHDLWPDDHLLYRDGFVEISLAGVLEPVKAVSALLATSHLVEVAASKLSPSNDGFTITAANGTVHGPFETVILVTGANQPFWVNAPVTPSLGQLEVFSGPAPAQIITDGHYVAPLSDKMITGATYGTYKGGAVAPSDANRLTNSAAAQELLSQDLGQHLESRAALRATTPDRHPIAGGMVDEPAARLAYQGLMKGLRKHYPSPPYHQGLLTLTGLGSRGLVTAPILAAHIAAHITGGVSPLTRSAADIVHPARFLIRDLRRGRVANETTL
ncbi:MAG: tRNA (5-methylaminomethyl-2-thiouridine)(34)-methyltransferase MnmD [Pseudomonadota bacterium]